MSDNKRSGQCVGIILTLTISNCLCCIYISIVYVGYIQFIVLVSSIRLRPAG